MGCPCENIIPDDQLLSPVCIGHLWMFQNLAAAELEVLVTNAVRRQRKKGDLIFVQGDVTMEMFLLKSGRVKLSKILENGSEITLDLRKSGDFIGESLLSEEAHYPVNAICMEDTLTCGFSKAQFEEIILRYPNIGLQVIRNMSGRISQLTTRVGSMATSSVEEKLYGVLEHVALQHGVKAEGGMVIEFPLTHEELGFLLGAHRVSVTRAMKYLQEVGRIGRQGRHLVVYDGKNER